MLTVESNAALHTVLVPDEGDAGCEWVSDIRAPPGNLGQRSKDCVEW